MQLLFYAIFYFHVFMQSREYCMQLVEKALFDNVTKYYQDTEDDKKAIRWVIN